MRSTLHSFPPRSRPPSLFVLCLVVPSPSGLRVKLTSSHCFFLLTEFLSPRTSLVQLDLGRVEIPPGPVPSPPYRCPSRPALRLLSSSSGVVGVLRHVISSLPSCVPPRSLASVPSSPLQLPQAFSPFFTYLVPMCLSPLFTRAFFLSNPCLPPAPWVFPSPLG